MSVGHEHVLERLGLAKLRRAVNVSKTSLQRPWASDALALGECWVHQFTPNMVPLEPGEVSPTRMNVSEAECRSIMATNESPVPSIHWREPVRTRGLRVRVRVGFRHTWEQNPNCDREFGACQ